MKDGAEDALLSLQFTHKVNKIPQVAALSVHLTFCMHTKPTQTNQASTTTYHRMHMSHTVQPPPPYNIQSSLFPLRETFPTAGVVTSCRIEGKNKILKLVGGRLCFEPTGYLYNYDRASWLVGQYGKLSRT